jgi:transmembrane sensor
MNVDSSIDKLIAKLFSGNISPDERKILSGWLNDQPDNKVYFNQMQNIWQVSHPAFDPETINVANAEQVVLKKIGEKRRQRLPLLVWFQRVAAVIILPLIAFSVYLYLKQSTITPETAYQEVFSPNGVRSIINLPDGSKVWLNSGSKLKFPVAFTDGERDVFLSGEAYFEVHADKRNPFIVETKNLKVKATGTAFNVEAYSLDTIVSVTLVHGKVNVKMSNSEKIDLTPNQKLSFHPHLKNYSLADIDPYKTCAWKDGVLAFRDDRLDYVFKKISQMYNVDIDIKNSEIASQLYRATFQGESLDEILKLLKLSAPIHYKRTDRVKLPDGEYSIEKIEVYKN